MDISPVIIGGLVSAICVPIIMILISKVKVFSYIAPENVDVKRLSEKYKKWERVGKLLTLIIVGVISCLFYLVFVGVARFSYSLLEDSLYLLLFPEFIWLLPSFLLAIFAAAVPLHYLYRYILGEEGYKEYTIYGNVKYKMDGWKTLSYMAILSVSVVAIVFPLMLDSYVRITNEGFVVNRFFSLGEEKYPFSRINRIVRVKSFVRASGKIVKPYHEIHFEDGYVWSFHDNAHDVNWVKEKEIISYLSKNITTKIEVQ